MTDPSTPRSNAFSDFEKARDTLLLATLRDWIRNLQTNPSDNLVRLALDETPLPFSVDLPTARRVFLRASAPQSFPPRHHPSPPPRRPPLPPLALTTCNYPPVPFCPPTLAPAHGVRPAAPGASPTTPMTFTSTLSSTFPTSTNAAFFLSFTLALRPRAILCFSIHPTSMPYPTPPRGVTHFSTPPETFGHTQVFPTFRNASSYSTSPVSSKHLIPRQSGAHSSTPQTATK